MSKASFIVSIKYDYVKNTNFDKIIDDLPELQLRN